MKQLVLHYTPQAYFDVPVYLGRASVNLLPSILADLDCDSVHVIADATAYFKLDGSPARRLLDSYPVYLQPAGEAHKGFSALRRHCDGFFTHGGTRKSCIVSLGGGTTGNVAGLVASLLYRGISLVHIPTTLIAQLDSAVDVKQSINSSVKNSIGTYHAPAAVVVDPDLLATLPTRQIRSGLAEAIKHGLAQDMGLVHRILSLDLTDLDQLAEIIEATVRLKFTHYHGTPRKWKEAQPTKLLTHIGHTVGKVIESLSVDEVSHGEAISHGMVIESILSRRLGLLASQDVDLVRSTLRRAGLLSRLPSVCTVRAITTRLLREESHPTFALLTALGTSQVASVAAPPAPVVDALQEWLVGVC